MSKNLDIAFLLDVYGELLTPKQRDFMELYYFEDLSLSEIAEHKNITRQGVHDVIRRSEQSLLDVEHKLGMAHKLMRLKMLFKNFQDLANKIKNINDMKDNPEISDLSQKILDEIKHGEEELF